MPDFLKETLGRYSGPFVPHLIRLVGIVIVSVVALRLIDSAVKRLGRMIPEGELIGSSRAERRMKTLGSIIRSVAKVVLFVFVGLTAAREAGYDIGPVLTSVGIAGVAIGFGAQSLVKDVIAGFFILFEDQFGLGDVVRIGPLAGEVEQMTLRSTTLRSTEGHVHVIPNGSIQTVTVLTKEWARAVVDVVVGYGEDINRVIQVLESVGEGLHKEWEDRLFSKPAVLGVENFSTDGITIRSIVKTPPTEQWAVAREWRKRIKDEFDRQGIQMAGSGPQTVWIKTPEESEKKQAAKA